MLTLLRKSRAPTLFVLIWCGFGCAYFNTMYNAQKSFEQAENTPRGSNGEITATHRQHYQETVRKCEKVLLLHPNSRWADDALYMLALSKLRLNETEDAVLQFESFMENFPNSNLHEKALFHLAEAYLAHGKPDQAVVVLDDFRERYTESKLYDRVYLLQGDILFEKQEYDRCIEAYRLLLEDFPRSPERVRARERIGESERERGNYEASLEQYRLILSERLEPEEMYRARWLIAKNLADLGRYEEALKEYGLMKESDVKLQTHMEMLLDRAEAEVNIAAYDKALTTLSTVTKKVPRSEISAKAWFAKGEIYQNHVGDEQEAIKAYDEVGQQYRRGELPRLALQRSNDIKRMRKLRLQLSAPEDDTSPEAIDARAEAQFLLAEVSLEQFDDPNRAVEEYRKVIEKFPQSSYAPRASYAIVWIYLKRLGDSDQALRAFYQLERDYPESVQAELAREVLGLPEKTAQGTSPVIPEDG